MNETRRVTIGVGDIVRLKSGGPLMTVASAETVQQGAGASVICVWFSEPSQKFFTDSFAIAVLASESVT